MVVMESFRTNNLQDCGHEPQQEQLHASRDSSCDRDESEQQEDSEVEIAEVQLEVVEAVVVAGEMAGRRWTEMKKKDRNGPCALVPCNDL